MKPETILIELFAQVVNTLLLLFFLYYFIPYITHATIFSFHYSSIRPTFYHPSNMRAFTSLLTNV